MADDASEFANLVGAADARADAANDSGGLSETEYEALYRLLCKVQSQPTIVTTNVHTRCHAIRKSIIAIAKHLDAHHLTLSGLHNADGLKRKDLIKREKSHRQSKMLRMKAADQKHINSVSMRKQRVEALTALMEQYADDSERPMMIEANENDKDSQPPSQSQSQALTTSTMELSDDAVSVNHSSYHYRSSLIAAESSIITTNNNPLSTTNVSGKSKKKNRIPQQGAVIDSAADNGASGGHSKPVVEDETAEAGDTSDEMWGPELTFPRSCYSCKQRFLRLHRFYDQFCRDCAILNWTKRKQLANLTNYVVLLTGCRVKIGYCVGLRLLRSGATLIGTSRFPIDTVRRYLQESDSAHWKHRLFVYGLDLRDLHAVFHFCSILAAVHPRIDCLINNAAQTVRRPVAYYRHLIPVESMSKAEMPLEWRDIVQFDDSHTSRIAKIQEQNQPSLTTGTDTCTSTETSTDAGTDSGRGSSATSVASTLPHSTSALLSQIALTQEDTASQSQQGQHFFPVGRFDVTGQQLDLRPVNSWLLTLDQVTPVELVEVFAINALAPFILCSGLRAALARSSTSTDAGTPRNAHVINVSAMEGKFYRHKSPFHPHTNMAKAALNMMTRTSAQDYAKQRVWMNAVDTGWINDENPYEKAQQIACESNFQTPIDEEDAAARILDPLMESVVNGVNHFGKFFKDYHETEW